MSLELSSHLAEMEDLRGPGTDLSCFEAFKPFVGVCICASKKDGSLFWRGGVGFLSLLLYV